MDANQVKGVRSRFNRVRSLIAIAIACLLLPHNAAADPPIPDQIRSAKRVYLANQTEDDGIRKAAIEQFTNWGRFTITQSKDDADLVVMFRKEATMDKWGNVGKVYMEIFLKGGQRPVLTTTSALHLIYDPQHRTKACISQFRKQLEAKN